MIQTGLGFFLFAKKSVIFRHIPIAAGEEGPHCVAECLESRPFRAALFQTLRDSLVFFDPVRYGLYVTVKQAHLHACAGPVLAVCSVEHIKNAGPLSAEYAEAGHARCD